MRSRMSRRNTTRDSEGAKRPRNLAASCGEARFLAIGQGRVAVTPMHVANAMAAIARNGQFRSPLLIRELKDKQEVRRLPVTVAQMALCCDAGC